MTTSHRPIHSSLLCDPAMSPVGRVGGALWDGSVEPCGTGRWSPVGRVRGALWDGSVEPCGTGRWSPVGRVGGALWDRAVEPCGTGPWSPVGRVRGALWDRALEPCETGPWSPVGPGRGAQWDGSVEPCAEGTMRFTPVVLQRARGVALLPDSESMWLWVCCFLAATGSWTHNPAVHRNMTSSSL